ncbi:MAG: hypothetical protein IKY66_10925 [Bacteroidales bacterium]|nr:hypothetical protein [Bacteroidales bacterium]
MKRIFIAFSLVAAAFALTNCAQKESIAPVQEETQEYLSFEVVANLPAETKTYNDGLSTKWSDDDRIKVIFTKSDGESDEADNAFTYAGSGKFVGKLEREIIYGFLSSFAGGSLTAVYPYDADGTVPSSTVQTGYDSMAHLAGANCPLSGTVKVSWSQDWLELIRTQKYTIPELTLEHTVSVVEVSVVNNTASAIEVSEVDFLVDGAVKSTTVVAEAGALAAGETAKVYIVVEPAAYAESQLSFQVNDTFEKVIEATEVTFTAGLIKQVNFVVE